MTKRILLSATLVSLFTGYAWYAAAQTEEDALRYSQLAPQGTARSIGFGGALGAIGGDFTSLGVNPAGIGVYRSSELTFTPSLKLNNTSSTYLGNTTDDNNTRFNVNNLGVVFSSSVTGERYNRSKWKAASFGMGISRVADFSKNYIYSGRNTTSSASEIFLADAIRYPNDFDNLATSAGLGYNSYLLDYVNDSIGYIKVPNFNTGLNQTRTVEERGGITDINFSFGGNYMEKLLIGATIGIPSVNYSRDVTLREEDASGNPDNDFDNFEYREALSTKGTGINLKLGFIYNVTSNFRAGVAFHTPTFFALNDIYSRSVVSNTENFKTFLNGTTPGGDINPITRVDAPVNEYSYGLVTPWRAVVSGAGIIGKRGFISLDYEFVDYSSTRYLFEDINSYQESEINNGIKNMYKGASNIRLGGEVRFDMVMMRLGFGYYGNPYQDASRGSERITASAGMGVRFDNVFIDLGFMHTAATNVENPYVAVYPNEIIAAPDATVKQGFNNIALTLGFKF